MYSLLVRPIYVLFVLVVGFLMNPLCLAVRAQDHASSVSTTPEPICWHENYEADNSPADDTKSPQCKKDFDRALNLFQHDWLGRFGRAFEYDFQRVEQPQFFQTGSGAVVANPERYLNAHTIKFQFSELFPASSVLADAFKNACALLNAGTDCLSPEQSYRIVGGGGWWRRALSGLTISTDLSERSALQQGVVVPETSFSNHYQVTGGFQFDPSQLFISGSNWGKSKLIPHSCKDSTDSEENCIRKLSRPRLLLKPLSLESELLTGNPGMLILAAVIPTVTFNRVSQFDFVKNGGILVPASFLENAQNQFTFKWDLKRTIPNATSRAALAPEAATTASKLCVIVSGGVSSYINVLPKFLARSCADFAKRTGARYALGCVSDDGISVGADREPDEPPDAKGPSCWRMDTTQEAFRN